MRLNQVKDVKIVAFFVSLKCDYCSTMFKYWVEKQDLKEKADKHYLFKMLEKHSGRWWC